MYLNNEYYFNQIQHSLYIFGTYTFYFFKSDSNRLILNNCILQKPILKT